MALASQSARPSRMAGPGSAPPRSRGPFGGRGPRQTAMIAVVAIGALAGGLWLINSLTGGPRDASADPGAPSEPAGQLTQHPTDGATSSLATGKLQPQPPVTPPVVLDMSRRAEPPPPSPTPSSAPAHTPGSANPAPSSGPGSQATPPANPSANPAANPAPPAANVPTGGSGEIQQWITAGERARQDNKYVEARTLFNKALLDPRTSENDREALRQLIGEINDQLVFSPAVAKGDPLTDTYNVQSGDLLVKIAARQGLGVDYRFIQRINKIADAGKISVGQKLKIVRGPFHAVVHKGAFRLDLYAGNPPTPSANKQLSAEGTEPDWLFIKSFKVGLGEHGGTPTGTFVVKPKSKLIDPPWVNPRTGEKFAAKDPKNPIGNRWLGLDGVDDQTRPFTGYGIHGTIDPSSIGREMSMGCVRMGAEDVQVVWELLQEGVSTVRIVP